MEKNKTRVIELLREGLKGTVIAERTGYTPSRISQIKKELEKDLPVEVTATEIKPSEAPPPINDWIEEQLKEAMLQCLDNLRTGIKTDPTTVDCIMLIAQLMRYMHDPMGTQPERLGSSETTDARQDLGTATPRGGNFMERLAAISGRTKHND